MRVLAGHEAPLSAEQHKDAVVLTVPDGQRSDRAGRMRLSECRSWGPVFSELVSDRAAKTGVAPRALGVRALLHLPRVATYDGWVTRTQVTQELFHSARWLHDDARDARTLIPVSKFALQELLFEPVAPAKAEAIFSSLHYLRSARQGSDNFALLDPVDRLPVSVCSVSPLEWRRVGSYLDTKFLDTKFGVSLDRTWDVSRVYSCDVAPPNAISFLLARVRNTLRLRGNGIELLTTAVDPNLGFTGASYRAANWQQWLTVQPRPYLYHERRYASPRQLRLRMGTSNLTELQAKYPGQRFEQSRARLLDSLIFCCRLSGETEAVDPSSQRRLHR